jgi:hypothetical protein
LPLNSQHLVPDLAAGPGIQSEPREHRGDLNVAGGGQQGIVVCGPGLAEASRRDDPGSEGLRGGVGRLTASAATIGGDEFGGCRTIIGSRRCLRQPLRWPKQSLAAPAEPSQNFLDPRTHESRRTPVSWEKSARGVHFGRESS